MSNQSEWLELAEVSEIEADDYYSKFMEYFWQGMKDQANCMWSHYLEKTAQSRYARKRAAEEGSVL